MGGERRHLALSEERFFHTRSWRGWSSRDKGPAGTAEGRGMTVAKSHPPSIQDCWGNREAVFVLVLCCAHSPPASKQVDQQSETSRSQKGETVMVLDEAKATVEMYSDH